MKVENKVVVVTGGASGIGVALAQRFSSEGAKAVVVADLNEEGANHVASSINGYSAVCDVANEEEIKNLVTNTVDEHGAIDLFVSNAGYVTVGGLEDDDSEMQKCLMFTLCLICTRQGMRSHIWSIKGEDGY